MVNKTLLALRNKKNKIKPGFLRQDITRKKGISKKWNKPTGIHSKQRTKNKGKGKLPRVGYSAPREIKGLSKNGFNLINISNTTEISKIRPNIDSIIINSKVGNRKRLSLLENLKKTGVEIANFKIIDKKIENIKKILEDRKKQRAAALNKRTESSLLKKEEKREETKEEKPIKKKREPKKWTYELKD